MYVEKVDTGAIFTITGEYAPTNRSDKEAIGEEWFFSVGDKAPQVMNHDTTWELVQVIDFAS